MAYPPPNRPIPSGPVARHRIPLKISPHTDDSSRKPDVRGPARPHYAGGRTWTWLAVLVVGGATLLLFARTLSADFVAWDDDFRIVGNSALGPLDGARLRMVFTDLNANAVATARYAPMALFTWCGIVHVSGGIKPLGFHLVNWLFHGGSAVLLLLSVRRLLTASSPSDARVPAWRITAAALAAALLWAWHPFRVEAVAWSAAGSYDQATFLLLCSLLASLAGAEATGLRRWLMLGSSVAAYLVSLASHPIGIGYPLALIIFDIYPLKRMGGAAGWWWPASARRAVLEKLPFLAISMAAVLVNLLVRAGTAHGFGASVPLSEFGVWSRFMQSMYVWAYYAWRACIPLRLSPVYTDLVEFEPASFPFLLSALLVVGVTTALLRMRRRWPLALSVWTCHLVLLVPVLGLTEHPHYPSDRYSLISSMGWSILVGAWLIRTQWQRIAWPVALIILGLLGFGSWRQSRIWSNTPTLYQHMIWALGNDPYRADIYWRFGKYHHQRGNPLAGNKALQESLRIDLDAIELKPNYAPLRRSAAAKALTLGQPDIAVTQFREAKQLKGDVDEISYGLALALHQTGRLDAAAMELEQLVQRNPSYPGAKESLAALRNAMRNRGSAPSLNLTPDYSN